MSEEIKAIGKEQTCFCKSELFQRTLAVTIGSFIGVYFALSLFCAMHKPPMMMHHHWGYGQIPMQHRVMHDNFKKHDRFNKDFRENESTIQKSTPKNLDD